MINCLNCGKETKNLKYCSRRCHVLKRWSDFREKQIIVMNICLNCGAETRNEKFCSNHCTTSWRDRVFNPWKGKHAWNFGLTKETDERLRNYLHPWNYGKHDVQKYNKKYVEEHSCFLCGKLTKNKKYCCLSCRNTPEGREQISKKVKDTLAFLPEGVIAERIRKSARKPNDGEKEFDEFLQDNFPGEWLYNGDVKIIIERKVPDFTNINGQKALIDFFGDHWHTLDEVEPRIAHFAKYGYKTLIIWASEFYKNKGLVKSKIKSFLEVK